MILETVVFLLVPSTAVYKQYIYKDKDITLIIGERTHVPTLHDKKDSKTNMNVYIGKSPKKAQSKINHQ